MREGGIRGQYAAGREHPIPRVPAVVEETRFRSEQHAGDVRENASGWKAVSGEFLPDLGDIS